MAGLLQARLPELGLTEVPDPRARSGRWSLAQILRATLVGLMAGCRSLAESEALTASLAPAMRRRLRLPRRLADTTARDALCRVPLDGVRAVLHRAVHAAWRRKALAPVGLPFGVVALDGKVTAVPTINDPLVQTQHPEVGLPYGLIRTVTASLVSAPGRPLADPLMSAPEVRAFSSAGTRGAGSISVEEALAAARRNGIDTRMFKVEYAGADPSYFGSSSFNPTDWSFESFRISRAPDGRAIITLYDKALSSETAAVETMAHELNHIRSVLKTGTISSEEAAEAAAQAAGRHIR